MVSAILGCSLGPQQNMEQLNFLNMADWFTTITPLSSWLANFIDSTPSPTLISKFYVWQPALISILLMFHPFSFRLSAPKNISTGPLKGAPTHVSRGPPEKLVPPLVCINIAYASGGTYNINLALNAIFTSSCEMLVPSLSLSIKRIALSISSGWRICDASWCPVFLSFTGIVTFCSFCHRYAKNWASFWSNYSGFTGGRPEV